MKQIIRESVRKTLFKFYLKTKIIFCTSRVENKFSLKEDLKIVVKYALSK